MSQERQLLIELLALKNLKEEYMRLKQRRSVWLKKDKELMAKVAQMKKEHDERYPVVWDKVKALLRPVDKSETTQYSDEWLKQRGQKARETLSKIPAELQPTLRIASALLQDNYTDDIHQYRNPAPYAAPALIPSPSKVVQVSCADNLKLAPNLTLMSQLGESDCDITKRVKRTLSKRSVLDESDISNDHRLSEELQMDSLDRVDLMLDLEDEFKIEIPQECDMSINTVQEVFDLVINRLKEKTS